MQFDIKSLYEDYRPDDDIFNDEDERLHHIKHIIFDDLTESERRILLIYTELGSLRKTGKELGVSAFTTYQKIKKIRKKIVDGLGE